MSSNKDGLNGLDIEQIALEKAILVGLQAPNIKPSIKIDKNGKSLPEVMISEHGGVQVLTTSGYTCGYVDTSWLNPTGIINMAAGNKIKLTAGSGGFEWVTAGPSKFNVAIQDFTCTHGFILNTRLFSVASTERTHLMGKRADFDYDEIYFAGKTNFLNNVCMAGSLFVNGELYCSHITTQKQQNVTEPSEESTGFLNPNTAFSVINGNSINSIIKCGAFGSDLPINSPFDVSIQLRLDLERLLPGIGSLLNLATTLVQVPCIIKFVEGISLCSDALIEYNPTSIQFLEVTKTTPLNTQKSDLFGAGHRHVFYGPAVNYKESTAEFYKETKEVMKSKTPTQAKPCVPNGGKSIWEVQEVITDAIKKDLTKWGKKMAENLMPEWLKNLTSSKSKE